MEQNSGKDPDLRGISQLSLERFKYFILERFQTAI
jgi:hypothetical protein